MKKQILIALAGFVGLSFANEQITKQRSDTDDYLIKKTKPEKNDADDYLIRKTKPKSDTVYLIRKLKKGSSSAWE